MGKLYLLLTAFIFCIAIQKAESAAWEKLYVKASTDCFRCVREVPSGGFVLAGYTSNFTPHDTDGLVVRLNDNGDTLWTFVYNGPSSKEDCFYKVVPTDDNGFILCGYSRSFGNGDNAFYLKLNSSGVFQWVKNWGGSGIERAQDIVELSDGSFVMCGYTTTAPAKYYDAFILKVDDSGNTLWSKIFGGTAYDDANSLKELPDGGFILGGQSNNQLYLIRTDPNGNAEWTQAFGTSGTDNIESVNFAQGGDGFILAGTTAGAGAGGEDGYLVKTDTGGVQVWAKTYGNGDNDGFHRVEKTSDGGYAGFGTSSQGTWANPNMWILKVDGSGTKMWEKFYGGNDHDHGYSGQPTSDGGYILAGHTHSFVSNNNAEDAYVVKMNSSGVVANELTWTTVTDFTAPVSGACGVNNAQIKIEVANYGIVSVSSIPVTVVISGAINQTINQTLSSTVAPNTKKTLTLTTTIDMSGGGTFNFHCYTGNTLDIISGNNFLDKSIVANVTPLDPVVTNGSHCGPGVVSLSASSPETLKWYSASSGGSSLATGSTYSTPYITSNTTYYVQAGTSCLSARVAVNANITAGLAIPTGTGNSRCGSGTLSLSGTSANTIKWYSSGTSTTVLSSGTTYVTPSLSSSANYYIADESASCTSPRVQVQAVINPITNDPIPVGGNKCGSGTVLIAVTSSDPVKWYVAASGGSSIGNGNSFTTPVISNSTIYYAQADDGICPSSRVAVNAVINTIPVAPVTTPGDNCGEGTVNLSATALDPIKWFDALVGGNQVGSSAALITPVITNTTTFYALTDNGPCRSSLVAAIATINPIPADPIVISGERCGEGTVSLSANGSDPVKWFDSQSGGNQVGSGNTFVTPSLSADAVYYAMADDGKCVGNRIAVNAVINPIPVVDIGLDSIFSLSSPYVLDAGPGFVNYVWSPTGSSQTDTAFITGKYCVTILDSKNCTASDCTFIQFSVGLNNEPEKNNIRVYRNYLNGGVTIELPDNHTAIEVTLFNVTGEKVFAGVMKSDKENFDVSNLSTGVYFIRLSDNKSSSGFKLMIE